MSLGSNEAIKHAVGAGLGLAVISALTIDARAGLAEDLDRGAPWVCLPVEGFPIQRQWSLVWRRDAPLSGPARQLVAYLQKGRNADTHG
jgi:DNA-binding transcriptional LysR family regulator